MAKIIEENYLIKKQFIDFKINLKSRVEIIDCIYADCHVKDCKKRAIKIIDHSQMDAPLRDIHTKYYIFATCKEHLDRIGDWK